MKKVLFLLMILFLAGCAGLGVRTYTVERPRVDTEIEGNQGYLFGQPPEEPAVESRLGSTRRIAVVEFEFGPKEDKEIKVVRPRTQEPEEFVREERPAVTEVEIKEPVRYPHGYEYRSYIVEKDDTLQKISSKFYGTTRRWMLIYEENRDILASPDKIHPGTEIRIPILK